MPRPYALPLPRPDPAARRSDRLRGYLLRTWPGRVLLAALVLLGLRVLGVPLPGFLEVLDTLALVYFGSVLGVRGVRLLVRRLLWRIRTKLLVSYLFVAVVPIILLALFITIAAFLSLSLVASYVVSSEIEGTGEQLLAIAQTASSGLPETGSLAEAIDRSLAPARALHAGLAYAVVRNGSVVARRGAAPVELPQWLKKDSFTGLIDRKGKPPLLRAVWRAGSSSVALDLPVDEAFSARLRQRLGIRLALDFAVTTQVGGDGIRIEDRPRAAAGAEAAPPSEPPASGEMGSFALADRVDWTTGKSEPEALLIRYRVQDLLRHLSPGSFDFGNVLLVRGLQVVGVTFLVMYGVALAIGLLLARSITKSVHALHVGTERLRSGDFAHQIPSGSRDQLGDLAESFNVMARGIQGLLREQAEKERLEEELRIARQIQMSLLPRATVSLPGLRIAALCLPAAEVGGDYYDLLPLSDTRLGVLVADVSGKGTSAALYMAELKGLVLSLSRAYLSPAALLAEANRILAANLDSRSFVTMTYAVVDVGEGTMRYARAGHSPILHLEAKTGLTRVLAPAGLGLGMDRGERFDQILEEAQVELRGGDIFLFFTDGLSEAMNPSAELFGERRLRDVLERSEGLGSEELKERILSEVRDFVGDAAQHDDMTLVILKVI